MPKTSYYRRCACKEVKIDDFGAPILKADGTPEMRQLGAQCPDLKKKAHGRWYFQVELEPDAAGNRQRVRRGGFRTKAKAEEEAEKVWNDAQHGVDVQSNETVEQYLTAWLKGKRNLARYTYSNYRDDINNYLIPHLGRYRLRDLRLRHLDAMYDAIQKENDKRLQQHALAKQASEECAARKRDWQSAPPGTAGRRELRLAWHAANEARLAARRGLRKPVGPATQQRINTTLSSALSSAVARQLITRNWAKLVELPAAKKPKALIWTDERVDAWRKSGIRPSSVMVWTPEQTGRFLDATASDRLHSLWLVLVFLGLRRGEACALTWSEVNLSVGWLRVSAQVVAVDRETYTEQPKADSVRTMSISVEMVRALRAWKARQQYERAAMLREGAWVESDLVFTKENGEGYHPLELYRAFQRVIKIHDLPPIRLHDLRHGSATLSLLGGNDIKVVQARLGHSRRSITSDTYTSVMPQLMRAEAENTMSVVPRARRSPGLARDL
ncbi:tyrosine-type recombinase/integrase [Streptomyces sp. NPDC049555]|uniref:tyrosine-type recombinase/integrase n=1 Tax=Streptomyces sp. NPDC049555 TaxID=3154930 RepID=UPI0034187A51